MTTQNNDADDNIIETMTEAFDNGHFYGLEYVLDEWLEKTPPMRLQPSNWFDFCEFRD